MKTSTVHSVELLASFSILAALSLMSVAAAADAAYPNKTVRMVVPWPAGGTTDSIARILSARLNAKLNQNFLVDNRPGANGFIGTQAVLQAPRDGYTLLVMAGSLHSFTPNMVKTMPFDPIDDFVPVVPLVTFPYIMVVPANAPYGSVADLVKYARGAPGKLTYGSFGTGSAPHLITELFKLTAGVDMVHVPYKGGSQAAAELMGGQISMLIDSLPSSMPHVKSGRLKALGVTSPKRVATASEIPTVSETLQGFNATGWLGIGAPQKTPAGPLKVISDAVKEIAIEPEFNQRVQALGAEPFKLDTSAAFRDFMVKEKARWGSVVATAKIPLTE